MLKTIITEAFFFLSGFTFTSIHDSQDNRGKGEAISLTPPEEKNVFGHRIYGEVILNWRTNDQIMPRWQRSFINEKCIFQYPGHCKSLPED